MPGGINTKFEIYIKYMILSKENRDNNNGKNTTAQALFYLPFEQRTNTDETITTQSVVLNRGRNKGNAFYYYYYSII